VQRTGLALASDALSVSPLREDEEYREEGEDEGYVAAGLADPHVDFFWGGGFDGWVRWGGIFLGLVVE